ncbi:MAG TPA: hypothetical protein VM802_24115 [Chitinophaga sp.]|uniref:hypothetical protein n=1 Tax=Chitinophaga sp. TaxID=1869181 RepID=UPI002CCEF717|nr:hypothetical protein [Chitinophaga sp.]HVI47975.1 hypothetical protein [Chitinophaga sp.]
MKKLALKAQALTTETLSREQMKGVHGGGIEGSGIQRQPVCYRCCPDDPCVPYRIYCPDVLCPVVAIS